MSTTRFAIVGLDGQFVERYATREMAYIRCARLAEETDYAAQDKADADFCHRYGVPFQPRRYFVMEARNLP